MGRRAEFVQPSLPISFEPKVNDVSFIREGAKRFAAKQGRTFSSIGLGDMQADTHRGQEMAQVYGRLPSFEDAATRHFDAMRNETNAQYDYLTKPRTGGGLGVSVEVTHTDPYKSHDDMVKDLSVSRRLKVLSTEATGGHPFFSNEENDKFRAVHDAFGHAAIGRGFSRHGEEAAYHAHAQMYSPEALPALATETRGQNSSLNYGRLGHAPLGDAAVPSFDEQKVARFPAQFTDVQPRIRRLRRS